MYPVRLSLPGGTGAGDLMAVKEQVRAVPRRGIGFGLLRYLHPDDEVRDRLAGGARAEVVFNYLGQADAGQVPETMFAMSAESTGAPHAPSQQRHHLVNVNAIVLDGRLTASFTYSTAVHAESTMEALADRFRDSLVACLDADLPLSPADFPDAALSQGEFDELMAELGEGE
jgi:non-ribosomal peptide synthase protein (TIGR01720 family)